MLFALGLGSDLIAVTHECDYPEAALELPRITRDVLPQGLTSAEIDAAVKERTLEGQSIYELDAEQLHDLRPDLIITQALCSVCAVSYDDVRAIADEIERGRQCSHSTPIRSGRCSATRAQSRSSPTQGTRRSSSYAMPPPGSTVYG